MPLRGALFDLDDTLFDHRHATEQALSALCVEEPAFTRWSVDQLRARHSDVLEELHGAVLAGRVSLSSAREERFRRLLAEALSASPPDGRAMRLADHYRAAYQQSWRPVPGAVSLLTHLRSAGLTIAVVTNGLIAEQSLKVQRCGLGAVVDVLLTAEETGVAKPDTAFFHEALGRLGVQPLEAVMVGDAWQTDIEGALAAGIRPVWFNWRGQPTPDRAVPELRALEPVDCAAAVIYGGV